MKYLRLVCLCLACQWAFGEVVVPGWESVAAASSEVFDELDLAREPGCAVGVIHQGRYVIAQGYGMANLEHGIPISTRSVFRTGSVSKQFTAAAIAILARRGEIDLDADIHRYLPDLMAWEHTVTVRQIVHHLSGLPDYEGDAPEFIKPDGKPFRFGNEDYYTIDEFYDRVREVDLVLEPETEFLYSNTAYFLLSQIVEEVTGQTLRQFAANEIFGPLDMTQSFFNDNVNEPVLHRADGYRRMPNGEYEIYMTNLSWVGEGGVYSSLDDFIKWDRNFYHNVLNDGDGALIDMLQSPHPFFGSDGSGYAWGMDVDIEDGMKVYSHGGEWVGFTANYVRIPAASLSLVALCNGGSEYPWKWTDAVRDLALATAAR